MQFAFLLCLPSFAVATYSVVAVDAETSQVGGAGTSCVGTLDVRIILGVVPGVGCVHAQAALNEAGRDEAVRLLAQGASPMQVIESIASPAFDLRFETRQYGVVDLKGGQAAFTGASNGDWAGDTGVSTGRFTASVQGNILTSEAVVNNTKDGFIQSATSCDLAEGLMKALERGAENNQGDSRCTPRGIPSDSAFIEVVSETGEVLLSLSETNTGNVSPLLELRRKFDHWRSSHECGAQSHYSQMIDNATSSKAQRSSLPAALQLAATTTYVAATFGEVILV